MNFSDLKEGDWFKLNDKFYQVYEKHNYNSTLIPLAGNRNPGLESVKDYKGWGWNKEFRSSLTTINCFAHHNVGSVEKVVLAEILQEAPTEFQVGDWVEQDGEVFQIASKAITRENEFVYIGTNESCEEVTISLKDYKAFNTLPSRANTGRFKQIPISKKITKVNFPFDKICSILNRKNIPVIYKGELHWARRSFNISSTETLVSITKNESDPEYVAWDVNPKDLIFIFNQDKIEGKNNMPTPTEKPSTWNMVKNDAEKAAYRVGARRISDLTKNALVTLLKQYKVKKSHINAIIELADTEYGHALVSMGLGVLIVRIPKLKDDKRVQLLCEEFRIEGMAIAGEQLLDTLLENIAPALTDVLKALPNAENSDFKMRISPEEEAEQVKPVPEDKAGRRTK